MKGISFFNFHTYVNNSVLSTNYFNILLLVVWCCVFALLHSGIPRHNLFAINVKKEIIKMKKTIGISCKNLSTIKRQFVISMFGSKKKLTSKQKSSLVRKEYLYIYNTYIIYIHIF